MIRQIDEHTQIQKLINVIQDKIDALHLQDYMVTEIHYILSHLNLYKLQNLKNNMRSVLAMLKKINKQHHSFVKQVDDTVQTYICHEYHTFTSKMKTLINLNVSEMAHSTKITKNHHKRDLINQKIVKYQDHKKPKISTTSSDL